MGIRHEDVEIQTVGGAVLRGWCVPFPLCWRAPPPPTFVPHAVLLDAGPGPQWSACVEEISTHAHCARMILHGMLPGGKFGTKYVGCNMTQDDLVQ